jgi:hypothetical protein
MGETYLFNKRNFEYGIPKKIEYNNSEMKTFKMTYKGMLIYSYTIDGYIEFNKKGEVTVNKTICTLKKVDSGGAAKVLLSSKSSTKWLITNNETVKLCKRNNQYIIKQGVLVFLNLNN